MIRASDNLLPFDQPQPPPRGQAHETPLTRVLAAMATVERLRTALEAACRELQDAQRWLDE